MIDKVINVNVSNFSGTNFTHRFVFANDGSENIYFTNINIDLENSNYTGISNFAIDSSIKNCHINEGYFNYCLVTGDLPNMFTNCKFFNLHSGFKNSNPIKVFNSSIKVVDGSSRIAYFNSSAYFEYVDFSVEGSVTAEGVYISPSVNTNSVFLKNCVFLSDTPMPLLIAGGKDHMKIGNNFPVSTKPEKIKISASTQGECIIKENIIPPSANAIVDNTNNAIISDNIGFEIATSGTTSNRPSNPKINQQYFDTSLPNAIPIWYNGTNWVNSAGVIV